MSRVLQHFLEPNASDLFKGYRIRVAAKKVSLDRLAQLGWAVWVGYLRLLQARRRRMSAGPAVSRGSALALLIILPYC